MSLPAQKDLFSKRYRTVPRLDPYEYQLQISLVDRLRWQCREGVEFYHCANGELRDARTGAKLKAMGLKPGVADLEFVWGELVSVVAEPRPMIFPRVLYLELKARGGKQTEAQKQFETSVTAKGCFYELADNIDEAVCILQKHRILP
jgi:hypothetical protein